MGVYEYWKTRLMMQIIKTGMTVVDVGVNKGYFSFLAARLIDNSGSVLSFEPDATNCHWIRKGIALNQYTSVKLFQIALADTNGSMTFYPGKKSGWGSLFLTPRKARPEPQSTTVQTRRLDDILGELDIRHIDVLKIDVEGADLLVLKGAEKILKESQNIHLIMDIDVQSTEEKKELFDRLVSHGFHIYRIGRRLIPLNDIEDAGKDIYACKGKPHRLGIGDEEAKRTS